MPTLRHAWGSAVRTGLLLGAVGVYLGLVGIIETFAQREIIGGVLSMGHTLLFATALGAGFVAGRRVAGGLAAAAAYGAVAGLAWGVVLVALVTVAPAIHLRAMFISASPALFSILALGGEAGGAWILVPAGVAAGALGAAVALIPSRVRRPLGVGTAWVLFFGLFQDLIKLLIQSDSLEPLRDLLFGASGLTIPGAAIVFAAGAAGSALLSSRSAAVRARVAALPPRPHRALRIAALAVAVALVLLLPVGGGSFFSQVLVLVGLYTLMGLGLNLEVGFAGLLDLGFVAFFAVGAYTAGLLTSTGDLGLAHWSFWAAVPVAVVVALIAGVLFGLPILGIRGDYLAIATLGFGEIIRLLVLSDFLRPWLGGSQGVLSIPKPVAILPQMAGGTLVVGPFEFAGPEQLYYLTLAASALVAFVAVRLRDSRLGRAWMAMREDEDVAEAMGINLVNIKLLAYGIGAAFAGMSGAIFAVMLGSVFPHSFSLLISINVLALIIVGGMGSLPGVAVGSLVLVGLPELLREFTEYRFLVYGAVLILMMQWRPEGLWPEATRRRELHEAEPVAVEAEPERALAGVEGEAG